MPLPGLRLPASASLSLASCWPLPQQLLPVSAAGGGRRRCSYRGEALAYRKASPLRQRLPYKGSCRGACDEAERLYEGEPAGRPKPLPKGEPLHLHDTALLRWNKWQSSYKINDASFNIGCLPTWQSSPRLANYLLCQQGTSLPPWQSSFYGVGTLIFWNFAR